MNIEDLFSFTIDSEVRPRASLRVRERGQHLGRKMADKTNILFLPSPSISLSSTTVRLVTSGRCVLLLTTTPLDIVDPLIGVQIPHAANLAGAERVQAAIIAVIHEVMDRILTWLGASVSALFSPVKCELQYISEQDQPGG